jgi:myo-inositol catabolism protein IolC
MLAVDSGWVTDLPTSSRFEPSSASPLFVVAMDHRDSFGRTLFGVKGVPTEAQVEAMRSAKQVIYEGARLATAEGLAVGRAGILVDEHLGADVARQAKIDHFILAMPIEKSGTELFELEYGDDFAQHVEEFDPDFFKVLVRYNPNDDPQTRNTQIERLANVSAWAKDADWRWLFELLVPPTREQLARYDDQYHFDEFARPGLTVTTIAAFTEGGVRPTIWKLEGYETTEGAQEVLDAVARAGEPLADCIVLGRNAPLSQVEHWIDVAAPLTGFVGFAVGRTIWEVPLQSMLSGASSRDDAVKAVAGNYRELIDDYCAALAPR